MLGAKLAISKVRASPLKPKPTFPPALPFSGHCAIILSDSKHKSCLSFFSFKYSSQPWCLGLFFFLSNILEILTFISIALKWLQQDLWYFHYHTSKLISLSVFWLGPPFDTHLLTSHSFAQKSPMITHCQEYNYIFLVWNSGPDCFCSIISKYLDLTLFNSLFFPLKYSASVF